MLRRRFDGPAEMLILPECRATRRWLEAGNGLKHDI
jgi:hypothetical protein